METRKEVSCIITWFCWFLPYLWGMETWSKFRVFIAFLGSYRTYEEWKHPKIPVNLYISVLFLPYLWGMETNFDKLFFHLFKRSYRTYEEWKLRNLSDVQAAFESSYRTYEEWKRRSGISTWKCNLSSYRTYEEWKHRYSDVHGKREWVLTVPMRNGNNQTEEHQLWVFPSSYRTYEEWKLGAAALSTWAKFGSYRTYEEWKQT